MEPVAERTKRIKPSPTLAVTARAKELKSQGVDVVGFGAGEPDFDTPDNIKAAANAAIAEGFTKYTPAGGMDELKDAVIEKFRKDNGLTYSRKEILISCGGKHSLYNLFMAVLNPGDEIIVPAPYWVSYPDMALLSDATPVIVSGQEANGFRITPSDLEKAITPKTRALVINSPSNPTGAAYTGEELTALTQVALTHNLLIISDEIYEKMVYDGFPFISVASLGEEIKKNTVVCNGVSKTYSMTGWRIGYAAGPPAIIGAMNNIQSQSTSNPTSIAQKAAIEALRGPQDSVNKMVAEFDKRRMYIVDRLNSIPGVTCFKPQGSFYVFPNVSSYYGKTGAGKKLGGSGDLAAYLREPAQVAVVSGDAFGSDEHIRLSYATSMATIEKGLDRIEAALKELK